MFKVPDWYLTVSRRLSDVFDEIGVNEKMLMKRRRSFLLDETTQAIWERLLPTKSLFYFLGSQPEGTTTTGLNSDFDQVVCYTGRVIIQDMSEWTPEADTHLMIQDEKTQPGYCRLQKLRDDAPLPVIGEYGNYYVKDTHGRVLYKNTNLNAFPLAGHRQGPAQSTKGQLGCIDTDTVLALPLKSLPQEVKCWLNQQVGGSLVTEDVKRYIERTNYFVVGIGNRASENEAFEWRISTTLAERCVMFNLNITQIRCYILMKIILKTYINPHYPDCLSSYMCKTVLLHCIKNKHSSLWKENNFLACISHCLLTLHDCILSKICPHFIIKANNLMAGKFSYQEKIQLAKLTSNLRQNIDNAILGIPIDDLGLRLQIKLHMVPWLQYNIKPSFYFGLKTAGNLLWNTAYGSDRRYRNKILKKLTPINLNMSNHFLFNIMLHLIRNFRKGSKWEKTACQQLIPQFCTTIGSLTASYNIQQNNTVSPQALTWFSAGLDTDVASSRLKLASVYYCIGDMENVAHILGHIEKCYSDLVAAVCSCYNFNNVNVNIGFCSISSQSNEEATGHVIAFCVRFLPSEFNCVPYELQYEMFRSTEDEILHRNKIEDFWMDWAVVDSLPYLYFLQYKTFGQLHRNEDQKHALRNLEWAIYTRQNLGHKDTAFNLLGQCMERENRPADAIRCYMMSLNIRPRNNVAKIHICVLLSKFICNNM
ncbi:uncharacterized protein LOC123545526 [Mercenaria mercenaria]|uniref:uncharacterized protein LOC123545526 n=1 Tax=Mercenaria mercenaria TaxID=6596 RepID=UPI00234F1085|nr:uncharacterized protein LOC123545526 [Mercenaria mercenaria]